MSYFQFVSLQVSSKNVLVAKPKVQKFYREEQKDYSNYFQQNIAFHKPASRLKNQHIGSKQGEMNLLQGKCKNTFQDERVKKSPKTPEVHFHLVNNDHELYNEVNKLMKKDAYLKISTLQGEEYLFLDVHSNIYKPIYSMEKYLSLYYAQKKGKPYYDEREKIAVALLRACGLSEHLQGYFFLLHLLIKYSYQNLDVKLDRSIYQELSGLHICSVTVIERSIRYAFSKSKLQGSNLEIIGRLRLEFARHWRQKQKLLTLNSKKVHSRSKRELYLPFSHPKVLDGKTYGPSYSS